MTIGKKLLGGTLTMLAVSAGAGYFTTRTIGQVRDLAGHGLTNASRTMDSVGALNTRMAMMRFAQRGVLLYTMAGDAKEASVQKQRLDDTFREIHANLATVRPLVNAEGSPRSLDKCESAVNSFESLSREAIADAAQGRVLDGVAALKIKIRPVATAMEAAAGEVAQQERQWVAEAMAQVNRRAESARQVQWVSLGLQLATAIGLSILSWKTVAMLRRSASEMSRVAGEVGCEARQTAERGQSLAAGASEQTASIEKTSASTEEILAMTSRIGENAEHAAECMGQVTQDVAGAEGALDRALAAMERLTNSQRKISGIIQTIDGIAFQTNLLALNAAVEAARSGAAGAGFAVVADEVRTLAQRCAQAARDTNALIQESGCNSTDAKQTLHQVETSVRAIAQSAVRSKGLVDDVHTSCRQQAIGMQQISQGLLVMGQVTQRAADTAEEEAAVGAMMLGHVEALAGVVDHMNRMVNGGQDEAILAAR